MRRFITAVALVLLCALPASAAEPLHLFVYNVDGWHTTIRYINTTDTAVPVPGGLIIGGGTYHGDAIAPHDVYVQATDTTGYVDVTPDPALLVQTEVVSPTGSRFRSDPLTARPTHYLYDLVPPGTDGFNSGVVVIAATDSMVSVDGDETLMKAGELRVFSNTKNVAVVRNEWSVVVGCQRCVRGDIFALAYAVKWNNGSIFAVPSR